MECIKCDIDNKLKERTANSGKCKKCGHQFVFEPTKVYSQLGFSFRFTDKFFANQIKKISAENTLFFTEKQFLYHFDRCYKNELNSSEYLSFFVTFILGLFALGAFLNVFSAIVKFDIGGVFDSLFASIFSGGLHLL